MVLVFDVDGTILDTFPHIKASYIEVFRLWFPEHTLTEEELKSFFGPPLPDTFRPYAKNEAMVEELVKTYREVSKKNMKDYLDVFPKTHETLAMFKNMGYRLAVLSNKQKQAILDGFELVGLQDTFDYVIGYDSVTNPKPDSEGINKIMVHFQDDCLLIGDTDFDILTAQNANIKSVGVTWALTTREQLLEAGADYVIDDFDELLKIVKEI